jgi:hypothetical protein
LIRRLRVRLGLRLSGAHTPVGSAFTTRSGAGYRESNNLWVQLLLWAGLGEVPADRRHRRLAVRVMPLTSDFAGGVEDRRLDDSRNRLWLGFDV